MQMIDCVARSVVLRPSCGNAVRHELIIEVIDKVTAENTYSKFHLVMSNLKQKKLNVTATV